MQAVRLRLMDSVTSQLIVDATASQFRAEARYPGMRSRRPRADIHAAKEISEERGLFRSSRSRQPAVHDFEPDGKLRRQCDTVRDDDQNVLLSAVQTE